MEEETPVPNDSVDNMIGLSIEQNTLNLLRTALANGEDSGWVEDFNPLAFKERLKDSFSNTGL
ncbi:MAG TPA: hypothetical protein VGN64_05860 [Dyadobacter sp.]|jgi:hypothetical protein|nr:hypothetical protein [Dyadobacter sp.]